MLPKLNSKNNESFIRKIEIDKKAKAIRVWYVNTQSKPQQMPYDDQTLKELNKQIAKQQEALTNTCNYNSIIQNEIIKPKDKWSFGLSIASIMITLGAVAHLGLTGDLSNAIIMFLTAGIPHNVSALIFKRKERKLAEIITTLSNLSQYNAEIEQELTKEKQPTATIKQLFVTETINKEQTKTTTETKGQTETIQEAHLGEIDEKYKKYFLEELKGDPQYLPLLIDYILMETKSIDELKKLLQWFTILAEKGKINTPTAGLDIRRIRLQ